MILTMKGDGMTPLMMAITNNHTDTALYLLRRCNVGVQRHQNIGGISLQRHLGGPLHHAARYGNVDVVEELLRHEANLSKCSCSVCVCV